MWRSYCDEFGVYLSWNTVWSPSAIAWCCLRGLMFSRFGAIPACDRRRDRQTDGRTQDDSTHRASIPSRVEKLANLRCRWQTWYPQCCTQMSTISVINWWPTTADGHQFTTLAVHLSWQHLIRSKWQLIRLTPIKV